MYMFIHMFIHSSSAWHATKTPVAEHDTDDWIQPSPGMGSVPNQSRLQRKKYLKVGAASKEEAWGHDTKEVQRLSQ